MFGTVGRRDCLIFENAQHKTVSIALFNIRVPHYFRREMRGDINYSFYSLTPIRKDVLPAVLR